MKLIPPRVVLALATSATALIPTVGLPADARELVPDTTQTASQALVAQLTNDSTGNVIGHRIFYPDGTVFVAEDAAARSQKDCDSGQFCVWSSTGYTGSFRYRTGTGSKSLGGSVGSLWNNRSTVAPVTNSRSWLYAPAANLRKAARVSFNLSRQLGGQARAASPLATGGASSVLIPSHVSKYYFPDGTMRSIERRGLPLDDRGFVTRKEGSWSTRAPVSDETFDFSDHGPGFAAKLSTDPRRLFRQHVGDPAECQGSRASCLVSPLVDLHSSYVVPKKVVAETWRLLAQESGVSVISETRDRLGRHAIAFTIRGEDPNFQEVILADPATGAWLGNETVLVGRSSDFDFRAPAVVEFNAVVRSEFVGHSDVPN
jgi:hypothetical protein